MAVLSAVCNRFRGYVRRVWDFADPGLNYAETSTFDPPTHRDINIYVTWRMSFCTFLDAVI